MYYVCNLQCIHKNIIIHRLIGTTSPVDKFKNKNYKI